MTGRRIASMEGHVNRVVSAAYSPDGRRIVTASLDNTVRIWDAVTGKALATLVGHTDALSSATFSPDGHRIVTASRDNTARIWDAEDGRELVILRQHWGPVWAASFSPDGRYVATACEDGKARLSILNGLLDSVFNVGSALESADYSPDGSRLLAVSRDGAADILTLFPEVGGLESLLWKLSPSCPGVETRTHLLGQPDAEAERDEQACMVQVEKYNHN